MAKHIKINDDLFALTLSKKECADLISLLVGHLAEESIQGNQSGACPELRVSTNDNKQYRLVVAVERNK